MKAPTGQRYRPSPGEVERLLKEERERRRKLRIQQVREQSKANAAKIRDAVQKEKKKQIVKLGSEIKAEWEAERQEKLRIAQELYNRSVRNVGGAHKDAQEIPVSNREAVADENALRADIRHQTAVSKLRQEKREEEENAEQLRQMKQSAIDTERERAAKVAARPPPPEDPTDQIEMPKMHPVKFTDVEAFSSTHYHVPPDPCAVEKSTKYTDVDAITSAVEADELYQEREADKKRVIAERQEKARLRYKHAREKELLKVDYGHMMHDLSDLQRADVKRRQRIVATLPSAVFLPPHRRMEDLKDQQQDMEREFETMYMADTDYIGNLSLALDPNPPSDTDTVTESENQSTIETDTQNTTDPVQHPRQVAAFSTVQPKADNTLISGKLGLKQVIDKSKPPDSGLKRLLGRIRQQRTDWSQASSDVATSEYSTESSSQATSDGKNTATASLTQYSIQTESTTETATNSNRSEVDSLSTGEIESNSTVSEPTNFKSTGFRLPENGENKSNSFDRRPPQHRPLDVIREASSGLEEGTIKSTSEESVNARRKITNGELLAHPLETAAQLRGEIQDSSADFAVFLAEQKQKRAEMEDKNQQMKEQVAQQEANIQAQRNDLETRLSEIAKQKQKLISQIAAQSKPPITASQEHTQKHTSLPTQLTQPYLQTSSQPAVTYPSERNDRTTVINRPTQTPLAQSHSLMNQSSVPPPNLPPSVSQAPRPPLTTYSTTFTSATSSESPHFSGQQLTYSSSAHDPNVNQHDFLEKQRQDHYALRQARHDLEVRAAKLLQESQVTLSAPPPKDRFRELGHFQDVELSGSSLSDAEKRLSVLSLTSLNHNASLSSYMQMPMFGAGHNTTHSDQSSPLDKRATTSFRQLDLSQHPIPVETTADLSSQSLSAQPTSIVVAPPVSTHTSTGYQRTMGSPTSVYQPPIRPLHSQGTPSYQTFVTSTTTVVPHISSVPTVARPLLTQSSVLSSTPTISSHHQQAPHPHMYNGMQSIYNKQPTSFSTATYPYNSMYAKSAADSLIRQDQLDFATKQNSLKAQLAEIEKEKENMLRDAMYQAEPHESQGRFDADIARPPYNYFPDEKTSMNQQQEETQDESIIENSFLKGLEKLGEVNVTPMSNGSRGSTIESTPMAGDVPSLPDEDIPYFNSERLSVKSKSCGPSEDNFTARSRDVYDPRISGVTRLSDAQMKSDSPQREANIPSQNPESVSDLATLMASSLKEALALSNKLLHGSNTGESVPGRNVGHSLPGSNFPTESAISPGYQQHQDQGVSDEQSSFCPSENGISLQNDVSDMHIQSVRDYEPSAPDHSLSTGHNSSSGRSWHLELMEYSHSSENSSDAKNEDIQASVRLHKTSGDHQEGTDNQMEDRLSARDRPHLNDNLHNMDVMASYASDMFTQGLEMPPLTISGQKAAPQNVSSSFHALNSDTGETSTESFGLSLSQIAASSFANKLDGNPSESILTQYTAPSSVERVGWDLDFSDAALSQFSAGELSYSRMQPITEHIAPCDYTMPSHSIINEENNHTTTPAESSNVMTEQSDLENVPEMTEAREMTEFEALIQQNLQKGAKLISKSRHMREEQHLASEMENNDYSRIRDETGISDEPDLTLVSMTYSPEKTPGVMPTPAKPSEQSLQPSQHFISPSESSNFLSVDESQREISPLMTGESQMYVSEHSTKQLADLADDHLHAEGSVITSEWSSQTDAPDLPGTGDDRQEHISYVPTMDRLHSGIQEADQWVTLEHDSHENSQLSFEKHEQSLARNSLPSSSQHIVTDAQSYTETPHAYDPAQLSQLSTGPLSFTNSPNPAEDKYSQGTMELSTGPLTDDTRDFSQLSTGLITEQADLKKQTSGLSWITLESDLLPTDGSVNSCYDDSVAISQYSTESDVASYPSENQMSLEADHSSSQSDGTLQEAFMRKKAEFIQKSEKRHAEAKQKRHSETAKSKTSRPMKYKADGKQLITSEATNESAESLPLVSPNLSSASSSDSQKQDDDIVLGSSRDMGQTLKAWKKSRAPRSTLAKDPTSIKETSSEDRKNAEREMKERTDRLYSKSDEVKERKLIEKRKQEYADNREKAKAYHQKQQERRKKKAAKK